MNIADVNDLEKRFTYHEPFGTQTQRYEALRAKAKELATLILESCPTSREMSLALTKLEECSMWANASIARNEKPKPGDLDKADWVDTERKKCICGPTEGCSQCTKGMPSSPNST